MKQYLFLILCLMTSTCFAYECYMTPVLGKCWKDYDVTITIQDNTTNKLLASISVPKGKLWARKKISCHTRQGFIYKASFSPKIWKDNPKTEYSAKAIHYTLDKIKKNTVAWVIPICFPNDFSEVPIPPSAKTMCSCKEVLHTVPPVPGEIYY